MLIVKTFDLGHCDEKEYTRVVCVSKYQNKYVFSYNTKRQGWEIPGGHIEDGETWQEAAKREMYEETGATKVEIEPVCVYKINSYGLLCFCNILELEELPKEYEMEKIMLSTSLPDNLTFPDAYKTYFKTVNNYLKGKGVESKMNTEEYLGKTIKIKIDRPYGSKHPNHGFIYPVNYGYVPNTISGDGEELDAYLLGVFEPVEEFEGDCIAIIHRTNDNDDKLVVVPIGKEYSDDAINALTEFQEQYFEHKLIRNKKH